MGETTNEISRIREAGDHPPGRAVAPAGSSARWTSWAFRDDLLPLVRPVSGLRRPGGLEDRTAAPDRVWNRIPDEVRRQIVDLALDEPELSPRELAVRFTDTKATLSRKPRSIACSRPMT